MPATPSSPGAAALLVTALLVPVALAASAGPARAQGSTRLEIVVRNATAAPVQLAGTFGRFTSFEIIDEPGQLAPLKLHGPPHFCERACNQVHPEACSGGGDRTVTIAAGGEHRLPWNGELRRLRAARDGTCHDVVAAPPGRYLLQVCAQGGQCGLTRFSLPAGGSVFGGTRELVVVLRARDDAPPRCTAETTARALALSLAQARLALPPAVAATLGQGCPVRPAGCQDRAPGPRDLGPGPCRVWVGAASGRLEVEVRPEPRDGHPLRYEVWVDGDAVGTGRVTFERSRWARSADGQVLVRGEPRHVLHTHGGEAARIGHVTLVAHNRGTAPRRMTLRGVRWNAVPGQSKDLSVADVLTRPASPPGASGAPAQQWKKQSGPDLVLPPGSVTELLVGFAQQHAYQSWNNYFWAEVTVELGTGSRRERLVPAAELHVTRVTPLRVPRR